MSETIDIVMLGILASIITQLSKRLDIDPKITVTALVILFSAIYTAFNNFLDESTKQSVIVFATASLGTAELFYSFVIKKVLK